MASKAKLTLAKLRQTLKTTQAVALEKGILPRAKRHHKRLALLLEQGRALTPVGDTFRLKAASRVHTDWKVSLGLDARRFHMTGTLQRAAHAPQTFVKTANGFSIIWTRANFQATIPGRFTGKGKNRKPKRIFLNRYWAYINERALFRLGRLGAKQIEDIRARGLWAIDGHLKRNLKQAIRIKGGVKLVKVELGNLGLTGF
jgi:hypothetical protein